MTKQHMTLALCRGRHILLQCESAVFNHSVNPLDVDELERIAEYKLQWCSSLDLYVTGLTVALVAVLNVCHRMDIPVTLWHWDRDKAEYYPQEVV